MSIILTRSLKTIVTVLNKIYDNPPFRGNPMLNKKIYKVAIGHCQHLRPEVLDLFENLIKIRYQKLLNEFEIQYDKEGQLKVVEAELQSVQKILNTEYVKYGILPVLNKSFLEFWKETQTNIQLLSFLQIDFDEGNNKIIKILSEFEKYLSGNDFTLNLEKEVPFDIIEIFDQANLKNDTSKKNSIFSILKPMFSLTTMKNTATKGFAILLYFHYVKWYFDFLANEYNIIKELSYQEIVARTEQKKEKHKISNDIQIKINILLTNEEIIKFFSFFYLETGGTNQPFLLKKEVEELLKDGFQIPPKPTGRYFTLNFAGVQKTKAMIYHAFHELNKKTTNKHEKEKLAKFLKFNFNNFKDRKIEDIKNDIRAPRKLNNTIVFNKYLPH